MTLVEMKALIDPLRQRTVVPLSDLRALIAIAEAALEVDECPDWKRIAKLREALKGLK